jgi:hypothetical protein
VFNLRSKSLIKGGTIGSALVAYGYQWYEEQIVRFPVDEPARHKVLDLTVSPTAYSTRPCLRLLWERNHIQAGTLNWLPSARKFRTERPAASRSVQSLSQLKGL